MSTLDGRRVAVLATDGFEQTELTAPVKALRAAGASVDIIAPKSGMIQGMNHSEPGESVRVDRELSEATPQDYDALLIPGGRASPAALRLDDKAKAFAREFVHTDKPVGAICHGPWVLIDADLVAGRIMTGAEEVRRDLADAGARMVDQDVAVDGPIVTSRGPQDLPAFNKMLIQKIASMPAASAPKSIAFI